jgi:hypothetical protein
VTSTFKYAVAATFIFSLNLGTATVRGSQTRDHLTEAEADLVREAQILDKRMEVFIKAINRRLLVLTGNSDLSDKQLKKDSETWGELPKGTRAELLGDIARILDEAITNIDDVSARDEKNPLIAKAVRLLSTASQKTIDQLKSLNPPPQNEAERANLEQVNENAQSIIEAVAKLPAPTEREAKKKGKGN